MRWVLLAVAGLVALTLVTVGVVRYLTLPAPAAAAVLRDVTSPQAKASVTVVSCIPSATSGLLTVEYAITNPGPLTVNYLTTFRVQDRRGLMVGTVPALDDQVRPGLHAYRSPGLVDAAAVPPYSCTVLAVSQTVGS